MREVILDCDGVTTSHTRVTRATQALSRDVLRVRSSLWFVIKKPHCVNQDHDHLLPEGRGELHRRGLHQDPLQVEGRLIVTRLLTIESLFFKTIRKTVWTFNPFAEWKMETLILNRLFFDGLERYEVRR